MESLTTDTAALAATVITSKNPNAIREAWETAVELFNADPHSSDEDITIALTAFSTNEHTPESVIDDFWKNSAVRLLVDGVWHEFCDELLGLPETPAHVKQEIEEENL